MPSRDFFFFLSDEPDRTSKDQPVSIFNSRARSADSTQVELVLNRF